MIEKIKKSELFRNIVILMSGTVLAQALSYAVSPIISRIYNESDMADLGLYMRIVTLVSAIATARFELTLPLTKSDYHSFLLYRLSLKIAKIILLSCSVLAFVYLLFIPFDSSIVSLFLISIISSFFIVFINLGTNWSVRNKEYKKISNQKIVNSLSSNGFKLIFGFLGFTHIGLIFATFLGYFLSSFNFIRDFIKIKKTYIFSKVKTYQLVKEYKEFPIINLPHVFLDLGRDLLIGFLIVYHFGKNDFGSYVYSTMMLSLPFAIIGQSVSQVFFNKCSELVNKNLSIVKLVIKSYVLLFLISIIPFSLLFLYGEPIFVFVFGKSWSDAGAFSEILSIWMMFNFIISPSLTLPIILNRQRENFIFGLIGTLFQLFSFGVLPIIWGKSHQSFINSLWILSISQTVLLVITGLFFLKFAIKGRR